MSALNAGPDGFYHPKDEGEIRDLLLRAKCEGLKLRTTGGERTRARNHGLFAANDDFDIGHDRVYVFTGTRVSGDQGKVS